MLHNAFRLAHFPSASFPSILQVAAGRAWTKTRPACAYHRTALCQQVSGIPGMADMDGSNPDTRMTAPSTSRAGVPPPPHVAGSPSDSLAGHVTLTPALSNNRKNAARCTTPIRYPRNAGDLAKTATIRRRHKGVCYVNADDLTAEDSSFIDPAYDTGGEVQTDPPWTEIVASLATSESPVTIVYRNPFATAPILMVPDPQSPTDLHQNLLRLLCDKPPSSLRRLLTYHTAFPRFHSSSSFNLLITLAVRFASFGTAEQLLQRMRDEGIAPDLDTRKLRVRLMVRTGQWDRCWHEEQAWAEERGTAIPLSVWLEFFGTIKRGAFRQGTGHSSQAPNLASGAANATELGEFFTHVKGRPPASALLSIEAEKSRRFRLLMQQFPALTAVERARTYPRVVHHVVRALIRTNQRPLAMSLTGQYFETLPPVLDREWQKICLDIIHLHMTPGWKRNLSEYYVLKRTVVSFIEMHPSFRPTSETLFLLLRPLRGTKRCGTLAQELVYNFTNRWGQHLADEKVSRRLASFVLKEGDPGVARSYERSQKYLEEARAAWTAEEEVKTQLRGGDHGRKLRWSDALQFARRTVEGWRWRLFRRRLWRVRARRHSRNNANIQ